MASTPDLPPELQPLASSVPAPAAATDPPGPRPPWSPVSNGQIAMVMLIATEIMFFSGLIAAFIVLRQGAEWPPPGQPTLPVAITWANTFVLLASAVTMKLAVRAARRDEPSRVPPALGLTAFLGCLFLLVQGFEWVQLLGHGLTLASSTYGATFYTLIGTHGVHVVAAVIWLVIVWRIASKRPLTLVRVERLGLCAMYWYFVCGIWPFLFAIVYLL